MFVKILAQFLLCRHKKSSTSPSDIVIAIHPFGCAAKNVFSKYVGYFIPEIAQRTTVKFFKLIQLNPLAK